MVMLFAENDDLVAKEDRARLLSELNPKLVSTKTYKGFSHATWFCVEGRIFHLKYLICLLGCQA